jgi:hypothetical protein
VIGDLGRLGTRIDRDGSSATRRSADRLASGEHLPVDAAVEAVIGTITAVVGTGEPGGRPAVLALSPPDSSLRSFALRAGHRLTWVVGIAALRTPAPDRSRQPAGRG